MPDAPGDPAIGFALLQSLDDALETEPVALTVSSLTARFLSGDHQLTIQERREIMTSPALSESWSFLNRRTVGWIPALAAASSGEIETRPFTGGQMRFKQSARTAQLYVRIAFDSAQFSPSHLDLTGAAGDHVVVPLPQPHEPGEILLLLSLADPEHEKLALLLRDPRTIGQLAKR